MEGHFHLTHTRISGQTHLSVWRPNEVSEIGFIIVLKITIPSAGFEAFSTLGGFTLEPKVRFKCTWVEVHFKCTWNTIISLSANSFHTNLSPSTRENAKKKSKKSHTWKEKSDEAAAMWIISLPCLKKWILRLQMIDTSIISFWHFD